MAEKAREEADKLRAEAKRRLLSLFKIPAGYSSGEVERVVDCMIGAATLEVAASFRQANEVSTNGKDKS